MDAARALGGSAGNLFFLINFFLTAKAGLDWKCDDQVQSWLWPKVMNSDQQPSFFSIVDKQLTFFHSNSVVAVVVSTAAATAAVGKVNE